MVAVAGGRVGVAVGTGGVGVSGGGVSVAPDVGGGEGSLVGSGLGAAVTVGGIVGVGIRGMAAVGRVVDSASLVGESAGESPTSPPQPPSKTSIRAAVADAHRDQDRFLMGVLLVCKSNFRGQGGSKSLVGKLPLLGRVFYQIARSPDRQIARPADRQTAKAAHRLC